MKRQIPEGSREEAQVAESVLYGVLWQMFQTFGPLVAENFNFVNAEVHATGEGAPIIFDGLTIHMASGAYDVTITQARSEA